MKYLLTLICAFLLLSSCDNNDSETTQPVVNVTAKRTVLVYMAAEDSLNSEANKNIDDMVIGSKQLGDSSNLIVFIYSCDQNGSFPCIYRIANGTKTVIKQFTSDFISTSPETIKEIIQWTEEHYPSDSYGLVLWSHADGWIYTKDTVATSSSSKIRKSFGVDSGDNLQGWANKINIPTLAATLSSFPKFQFIFFDCCNMQCIENAYEFRNVTNYIIGSPAEIPALGAPYSIVVPDMFSTSSTYYKTIIDDYYNYYAKLYKNNGNGVLLSVIKTNELDSLASITSSKLSEFMPTVGRYPLTMSMDSLIYYFIDNVGNNLFYDMNDFMLKYLPSSDFTEWRNQFDRTVLYKTFSSTWVSEYFIDFKSFTVNDNTYGGVSMFVPLMEYMYMTGVFQYNETIKHFAWYDAAGWNKYGW